MVKISHPPRGVKRKHDTIQACDQGVSDRVSGEDGDDLAGTSSDIRDNNQKEIDRSESGIRLKDRQTSRSNHPLTELPSSHIASSSSQTGTDLIRSSDKVPRRWKPQNRAKTVRSKFFRMTDIMAIIYGMLDPPDKQNLILCNSTFLSLGARVGGLRQSQQEQWLSEWAKIRNDSQVSLQSLPGADTERDSQSVKHCPNRHSLWSLLVEIKSSSASTDVPLDT